MSLRDSILSQNDLKIEAVTVPEWNNMVVHIRTLTGTERDKFEASMVRVSKSGKPEQNMENVRARLVVLCVIDPDDNNLPVFTEKDIPLLGAKSASALDRVFSAAQRLNGFSDADVEDLAEGFDSGPSESSTSA